MPVPPVSGIVQSVTLSPGRADVIYVLFEDKTHDQAHSMNAIEGEVLCDGKKATPAELFAWLIEKGYPVRATLYPDVQRYGNAMKAEFSH